MPRNAASRWSSRAVRPGTPVLKRGNGVPPAREAVNGAYVFKRFRDNDKPKKVLVVERRPGDGQPARDSARSRKAMATSRLSRSPHRNSSRSCAATTRRRPTPILAEGERQYVTTLHNGWPGFLYPFLLPADHQDRAIGMDRFSRSGKPDEIYRNAGFDAKGLRERLLG